VLAISGVVCLTVATRADTEPAAAAPTPSAPKPALATPLWSPRRVPAVFGAVVAAAKLTRGLTSVAAPFSSCVAVDSATGPLTRIHTTTPLAGASTQKLLVAASALAVLGPQHRFETRAVATAPIHDGTLDGDLTIVGGGDPVLSTSDAPSTATAPNTRLSTLADAIVGAGVHRINGALVADDSRYDRARRSPDWTPGELAEGDVGALGALVVNAGYANNGLPASDPALDTVQALAPLLSARGVQIANGATDPAHAAPKSAREIAHVDSPPLAPIIEQMLTASNNETAELLTREIGFARAGSGTTGAGTQAIPAVLTKLGVPVAGVVLHDGSGLAPVDRITCATLLAIVELASQPKFSAIDRGLPVAGRTGTLFGRFGGTSLVGRLRAKTGHIDKVVGLAGVIDPSANGATPGAHFAFIANGDFSTDGGESLQDQVAGAISAYLDAPVAPGSVPPPR
jgi:D-alanyl-D-alanine carboxypeptidase/D-alanyl-D-alanine-endopeptidase (penicillin-binding protein 4)